MYQKVILSSRPHPLPWLRREPLGAFSLFLVPTSTSASTAGTAGNLVGSHVLSQARTQIFSRGFPVLYGASHGILMHQTGESLSIRSYDPHGFWGWLQMMEYEPEDVLSIQLQRCIMENYTKNTTLWWLSNPTSKHTSKGDHIRVSKRHLCSHVHGGTVHKKQVQNQPESPPADAWTKMTWIHTQWNNLQLWQKRKNSVICDLNESGGHQVKGKKLSTERQHLTFSLNTDGKIHSSKHSVSGSHIGWRMGKGTKFR